MKCNKCDNINTEEQLNCTECGEPLGGLVDQIETVLEPITEPLVDLISDAAGEEGLDPITEANEVSSMEAERRVAAYSENKNHKKSNKIIIGAVLLLLIGTLVAVYFNREGLITQPEKVQKNPGTQEQSVKSEVGFLSTLKSWLSFNKQETIESPEPESITAVGNKETIITINDEPIAHSVFNLYFWITQQRFESAGPNVWDMDSEGVKIIDIAKENTVKDIKLALAAKQKLNELGIIIDESEKGEIYNQANDIMTNNTQLGAMLQVDLSDMEEFILHGLYVQKAMEAIAEGYTPTEEEINENILQIQARFETATVKHVLIASKDDEAKALAEEVLQKALAGQDMAELAKTYSEDPGSKDTGGEYTFPKGQMVPEFEEASFTGEIGKVYPQLVETSYGYHIIKVEERSSGDSAEIRLQSEKAAKYYYAEKELTNLSENLTLQTTDLYDKVDIVR